ncbi:MAG: hypothetical protein O3B31_08435 [Chloroflexi bacterium]|nr:hypothetical protein [Chloroflexota bacterium]MDA1003356.1 hypothetical protein [Chloroflexota bacterium]MQC27789.1 hypothetical protein [Chloroflexota bacterium]
MGLQILRRRLCKDLDQIVEKATDEACKKKPKLTAAQADAIALQVDAVKFAIFGRQGAPGHRPVPPP